MKDQSDRRQSLSDKMSWMQEIQSRCKREDNNAQKLSSGLQSVHKMHKEVFYKPTTKEMVAKHWKKEEIVRNDAPVQEAGNLAGSKAKYE